MYSKRGSRTGPHLHGSNQYFCQEVAKWLKLAKATTILIFSRCRKEVRWSALLFLSASHTLSPFPAKKERAVPLETYHKNFITTTEYSIVFKRNFLLPFSS